MRGAANGLRGVKTAFLALWLGMILVAVVACAPASRPGEEVAGAVIFGAIIELPTMSEDAATADPEIIADRLEQIGAAVKETASVSAAASPVVATASPEPFRLAFSKDSSGVPDGEISARSQQALRALTSDLKIDRPSDPGILMAALIPGASGLDSQQEAIATPTPGVTTVVAINDEADRDGPSGDGPDEPESTPVADDTGADVSGTGGPATTIPEYLEQGEPAAGDTPAPAATPGRPVTEATPEDQIPAESGDVDEDLSGHGQASSGGVALGDVIGPEGAPGDHVRLKKNARGGRNDDSSDHSDARGKGGRTENVANTDGHKKVSGNIGESGGVSDTDLRSHVIRKGHGDGGPDRPSNESEDGPGHKNDSNRGRVGS